MSGPGRHAQPRRARGGPAPPGRHGEHREHQRDFLLASWATSALQALGLVRVQGGAWDTPGTAAEAAAVAAVVAAHLLLPLLLCWAGRQRRSRLWRSGFISVARLMMLTMVAPNFSSATFLRKPPLAGAAALLDAPRVLMGSQAFLLLFMGLLLPLPLAEHLAVHSACLGLVLAHAPRACAAPLFDNQVAEQRVAAVHQALGGLLLVVPPAWPPGGRAVQCRAALSALCLFAGWLVPTYAVLRWHCQERAQEAAAAAEAAAARARAGGGGAAAAAAAAPAVAKPSWSEWVAENVFMHGAPVEFRCHAWTALALGCWLAGSAWAAGRQPADGLSQE